MSDADTGFCAWPERPSYETQDGLYDVAWSEIHENQLVTASGDGSIKLWDVMINVGALPCAYSNIAPRLNIGASNYRTYPSSNGANIRERRSLWIGPISGRISSSHHHGMEQSNW